MHEVISTILATFESRGQEKYADEEVTQLQHALQCAQLARNASASDTLVAAALLHDIGHILSDHQLPTDCEVDLHDHHERIGFTFLKDHFGPAVADPVRLHVAAKRYLCTTDKNYKVKLSPTSLKSYFDQGGAMDALEIQDFENEPFFEDALRLRRWDDGAKDTRLPQVDIHDFVENVEAALTANESSQV